MKFEDMGNKKIITFEEYDTDYEKRILEQGLAFIRNILGRMNEIELEGKV